MSPVDMVDYYERLGVSRKASDDEIKQAFRKGARQYHPDVSKEENAEENFKMINEAYGVLSDEQKRRAYDSTLEDRINFDTSPSVEGDAVSSHMQGNGWVSTEDRVNDYIRRTIFGDYGFEGGGAQRTEPRNFWDDLTDMDPGMRAAKRMFDGAPPRQTAQKETSRPNRPIYNDKPQQTKTESTQTTDELKISENDLALILALKQAYTSQKDGKWHISRSENDKRGYPSEIFQVVRKNGNVVITRVVEDWRAVKENGKITPKYVSEEDLNNQEFRDQLKTEGINIPFGYSEYLEKLRALAIKDHLGLRDIGQIVSEINNMSNRMGENLPPITPTRENMLRFNISELGNQLKSREGQVMSISRRQVEGQESFNPGEKRV